MNNVTPKLMVFVKVTLDHGMVNEQPLCRAHK